MSPDLQMQMHEAITRGPSHLPEGLLAGTRPSQFRALKAYANTINHARHFALEETFPRTRELIGEDIFHQAAEAFLADPQALAQPLRRIGEHFPGRLGAPAARDLARAEWAWLEAHGAADAPAMLLERLKGVRPETLVDAKVLCHPATMLVELERPDSFSWPDIDGDGAILLVTRPEVQVQLVRVGRSEARLLDLAKSPTSFGRLLARDAEAATNLVKQGALRPLLELVL